MRGLFAGLAALLTFGAAPGLAFANVSPVQVKVLKVNPPQPCKCERDGEVKASKVLSTRCFIATKVSPQQSIEPISKMFLLMNDVLAKATIAQIPDAGSCDFKAGKTLKMWITDVDPEFPLVTPPCGHEPAGYADACEPYGRFMTFYRNESLKAKPAAAAPPAK